MCDKLVVYFSATGKTAAAAKKLAEAAGAELFEIKPAIPYSAEDLNWRDKTSRSSVEMSDKSSRPAISGELPDVSGVDTIYLGFPIWWYVAPTIVNAFLEGLDLSGKKIVLFATSGGSGFGRTVEGLKPSAPGATFVQGRVNPSGAEIEALAGK